MRRHSMYERDSAPRYRPHMPPQRYGPPLMRGGPMHRGPFMPGGSHRDNMYHPYNAPRPPYYRRDDFDKDFRDRRSSSNDRRNSTAYDSPRNYPPMDRQDSRDGTLGRRGSETRHESPPPSMFRGAQESEPPPPPSSWDNDPHDRDRDRDAPTNTGFAPPAPEPRSVPTEAPPTMDAPVAPSPPIQPQHMQPPIPPPGPPMPPPDSPAILPTPQTLHPMTPMQQPLMGSNSAPLLSPHPQSGMSSPLLGNAPGMPSPAHANTSNPPAFQGMTPVNLPQASMSNSSFNNFTTPFRNKVRPGFSPQHSFPGAAVNNNMMSMYSASPLGARASMPGTPAGAGAPRALLMMTPAQQQAFMQRQKIDALVAADKKLLEHVVGIWAVEEKDREKDKKVAEDARRLREADSRAAVEACRAMAALELATIRVAVCDSRLATIRQQIAVLEQ